MIYSLSRSALPLLACFFLAPLAARAASESLFDPTTARKLTPDQQALFGPNSKNFRYDKRMLHALQIAHDRARTHSTSRCWHYVKTALMAADAVSSYPKTEYAKQAGTELVASYGFKQIKVTDPYQAPVGAVLVYGGHGAGHVEIRTATGFVSDFTSVKASTRPLIGVYIKPKAK